MRPRPWNHLGAAVLLGLPGIAAAVERFPPPDFETSYRFPETTTPPPPAAWTEWVDVAVLLASLAVATILVHRVRRRRWLWALSGFGLLYFGFYRQGCICPIGAIGNVVLTLFDSQYALPLTALIFFVLPLLFALFVGRVFCAGVCPLGAIQDLVLWKPLTLPAWLDAALRVLPYTVLALAVLLAATGTDFLICRYDPFVAFFRLGGNAPIVVFGVSLLVIGLFVGRPYCRFLCPYSVLLRHFGRMARRPVTVSPDGCIHCRLCEDDCPFAALTLPTDPWPQSVVPQAKRLALISLAAWPVLSLLAGGAGYLAGPGLAAMNATVQTARRVSEEQAGRTSGTTDQSEAFYRTGRPAEELLQEAAVIEQRFRLGGFWLGLALGVVVGGKLVAACRRPPVDDYQADPAGCVACGRCFESCPREHRRRDMARIWRGAAP